MTDIIVIGGGASGIAAAITAADAGARVTLVEAGKRIGHSILASGNGRCNFSNAHVSAQAYWNEPFVQAAFGACPPRRVWEWFARLGLMWSQEEEGRLYPMANKASSVLDVLRFALDERAVRVLCSQRAVRVAHDGAVWQVECEDSTRFTADAVVVACGGQVARKLLPAGCRFMEPSARLCPLRTDAQALKGLDGVRVKARVSLLGACAANAGAGLPVKRVEAGEVQFRKDAVSGIVAFDLSRFASVGDVLEVDLLPSVAAGRLEADIARRVKAFPRRNAVELLAGVCLPLVAQAALRTMGLAPTQEASALAGREGELARALKGMRLPVLGFDAKAAQVRRGGVAVRQVDPATMGYSAAPGLYVTGEALDVDGPCGGYNLHWAWTSGLLAGGCAATG